MAVDPVKGGIYRHYKGGLYQVIGLSIEVDSNKICVVYWSLSKETMYHRLWFDFCAEVEPGIKRFTYVGKTFPLP